MIRKVQVISQIDSLAKTLHKKIKDVALQKSISNVFDMNLAEKFIDNKINDMPIFVWNIHDFCSYTTSKDLGLVNDYYDHLEEFAKSISTNLGFHKKFQIKIVYDDWDSGSIVLKYQRTTEVK